MKYYKPSEIGINWNKQRGVKIKSTQDVKEMMFRWFIRIKELIHPMSSIYVYNEIPFGVLPKSTKLNHNGIGIVINKHVKIGEYCTIGQNVTIGSVGYGKKVVAGEPTIENNVEIYANACIIGGITIAHHSVVGAGSTVYKDVPPYSLVVGDCKIYEAKYQKKRR